MSSISAVIITFNEEEKIARCLKSLEEVADEIIVVDSYSNDRTEEICNTFNVKFIQHSFEGYIEQKNYAMAQATSDFVLSLDADEVLSPELENSIQQKRQNFTADGYKMNRLTWYGNRWIRHSGWYPDTKLRLVRKGCAEWKGVNPHDQLVLTKGAQISNEDFLKGDLLHYSYDSIADHADKTNKFSTIAANEAFEKGKKAGLLKIILSPTWTIFRKLVIQMGWLDGYYGFIISIISGYGKFLKYSKLRELHRNKKPN